MHRFLLDADNREAGANVMVIAGKKNSEGLHGGGDMSHLDVARLANEAPKGAR